MPTVDGISSIDYADIEERKVLRETKVEVIRTRNYQRYVAEVLEEEREANMTRDKKVKFLQQGKGIKIVFTKSHLQPQPHPHFCR